MAYIGKDGKDDASRVAALGTSALAPTIAALASAPSTRYFRASYSLPTEAPQNLAASHVEFAEKMTLIGYVDSYGATSSSSYFIVFNAASAAEAQALANVSPLAVSGGASVTIQTLNTGVSIWS